MTVDTILLGIAALCGVVGIVFLIFPRTRSTGAVIFPLFPASAILAINITDTTNVITSWIFKACAALAIYALSSYVTGKVGNSYTVLKLEDYNHKLKSEVAQLHESYETLNRKFEAMGPAPTLPSHNAIEYLHPDDSSRSIVFRTGDIRDVQNIDVIVNSENTQMLPARYYDNSLSGTLRYLDATIGDDGHVKQDNLVGNLDKEIAEKDIHCPVMPGIVIVTKTSRLASKGIKYIFHVAAVEGRIGEGYQPIVDKIGECVYNCFARFRTKAQSEQITTILIPLFGTGTGKLNSREAATRILPSILQGMADAPEVKTSYLLIRTAPQLEAAKEVAAELNLQPKNP